MAWSIATLAGIWSMACGGGGASGALPRAALDPCMMARDTAVPRLDTVVIATPDAPSSPTADDHPGRGAARHLYETLVRFDCEGRVRPGLAQRWGSDGRGWAWTFTLAPDRRFEGGGPIDARAVVAALAGDSTAGIVAWSAGDSIRVSDTLTVRLWLAEQTATVPFGITDPALAVKGTPTANGWPAASGRFARVPLDGSSVMLLPRQGVDAPVLRFVPLAAAGDLRDALDGHGANGMRVDVVRTRDATVIDYASRRDALDVRPLPFDLTYVLVTAQGGAQPDVAPPAVRDELARDVVTSAARGAQRPFWWSGDPRCTQSAPPSAEAPASVVAHRSGDPIARALAERIAALASGSARPAWLADLLPRSPAGETFRVAPLDSVALNASLASGGAALYIVAYPRLPVAFCRDLPWRGNGYAELALVDSRAHLVVRRGAPPIALDADGGWRVVPDSAR